MRSGSGDATAESLSPSALAQRQLVTRRAPPLGPGFPHSHVVPVCPTPRQDQRKLTAWLVGAARSCRLPARVELQRWVATGMHIQLKHHSDNGYTRNVATTATAATLVAGRGKRLQKRRRAPPGGRAAPARTVRPWGGRPAPSFRKLIRKVPSYATTSSGFPTTGGVSATGTRCSVSPIELQHMPKGLRRAYR